jgi:hypothetical protein
MPRLFMCDHSESSPECFYGCEHKDPHTFSGDCIGGWCDGVRVSCILEKDALKLKEERKKNGV